MAGGISGTGATTGRVSLANQLTEAKRVLAQRQRRYPRLIERGTLHPEEAARRIEVQQDIVLTLTGLALQQGLG